MSANTFVWYELMTADPEAAEGFYAEVVGWEAERWSEAPRYTVMKAGAAVVAGVMAIPDDVRTAGGQPAWFGYVGVADVDAAAERLAAAGGTVHRPPADIPEVGRFAVVADPQGAVFMLFAPNAAAAARPAGDPMEAGQAGWRELYAADWTSAWDFYAGQFGWTKDMAVDMGPMGTYQTFAAEGAPIGGMMTKPDQVPRPAWQYYFTVPAIGEAAERVKAAGGTVVMGPHEVPGGSWIVNCLDPQGAVFSLVSRVR